MAKEVVHVLLHGRAACGLQGVPASWPEGHSFVSCIDHARLRLATCEECINRLSLLRGSELTPARPRDVR